MVIAEVAAHATLCLSVRRLDSPCGAYHLNPCTVLRLEYGSAQASQRSTPHPPLPSRRNFDQCYNQPPGKLILRLSKHEIHLKRFTVKFMQGSNGRLIWS